MSYSAIDMSYQAPAQGKSVVGALVGAVIGSVVGAVVLAAVVTVAPSNLYTATAIRPAVQAGVVSRPQNFVQARAVVGAQYAAQGAVFQGEQEVVAQAPSVVSVYSWAFVCFAAVAGAINGIFLWNNSRNVAMASTTGRREALMAGVAAAGMAAGPAFAAYGERANVFGSPKDVEQTKDVKGDTWSLTIPSKYNKSKEREAAGIAGRWEDNFDAVNNTYVLVKPIGKNSVTDLGDLDAVRASIVTPLLGQQAFSGPSISEGGFAPGKYSSAAVLDQQQVTKNGKTFYVYELLTRTADGNEGGRHQLFKVGASNGNLYVCRVQAGDKRWFKGLERPLRASLDSFDIA